MNCTDIHNHIADYLDQELSSLHSQAFEQHVSQCNACANLLLTERQLRTMLQDMPVPQSSADFRQRVFERVRAEYPPEPPMHLGMKLSAGFASFAMFGLALWLVSGMQAHDLPSEPSQVVAVAVDQSQSVRLVFDAQTDIQQAELSVDLPENVTLVGYPGRHSLSWQTSLQKGQNVLELPVQATRQGRGELRTQLSYNNKIRTYQFVVDAQASHSGNDTQSF